MVYLVAPKDGTISSRTVSSCPTTTTWLSSVEEAVGAPGAALIADWALEVWLELILVGSVVMDPEAGERPS
jgi:hypothetical protein